MSARLLALRRLPIRARNPADNVICESLNLRCTVCGHRWPVGLEPVGDRIDPRESTCPRFASHKEPPTAA